MFKLRKWLLCSLLFISTATRAQPLAFPGAEGFGALATGGRGGTIVHVANLNDSGPGSFRDAVGQPKRIVIFDVGGLITLKSPVSIASNRPAVVTALQLSPHDVITSGGWTRHDQAP